MNAVVVCGGGGVLRASRWAGAMMGGGISALRFFEKSREEEKSMKAMEVDGTV